METSKNLDTVRERARSQRRHSVKLNKSNEEITRQSLQNIRTLKSLATEADMDEEVLADACMFDKMWDWFQRSIGNR